jgi:hypothetical protein
MMPKVDDDNTPQNTMPTGVAKKLIVKRPYERTDDDKQRASTCQ